MQLKASSGDKIWWGRSDRHPNPKLIIWLDSLSRGNCATTTRHISKRHDKYRLDRSFLASIAPLINLLTISLRIRPHSQTQVWEFDIEILSQGLHKTSTLCAIQLSLTQNFAKEGQIIRFFQPLFHFEGFISLHSQGYLNFFTSISQ